MTWELVANIATSVTSVTLVLAIVQLIREARVQHTQSFIYLHSYLAQQEFSLARKHVRTELLTKPYETWSADDLCAANTVCASYDQMGILITLGVLDRRTRRGVLASSWGKSILDQYEVLEPFLSSLQTPHQTGREFFRHFGELVEEARRLQPEAGVEGCVDEEDRQGT